MIWLQLIISVVTVINLYSHVSQIQDTDLSNSLIVGPRSKRQDSRNFNDTKAFAVRTVKVYRRPVV